MVRPDKNTAATTQGITFTARRDKARSTSRRDSRETAEVCITLKTKASKKTPPTKITAKNKWARCAQA